MSSTGRYTLATPVVRVRDLQGMAGFPESSGNCGRPWASIDEVANSLEPPRVQPSKKVAAHWDEDGNRVED